MTKLFKKPTIARIILKLESPFNCNQLKTSILNLALKYNLIIDSQKNLFIDFKKSNQISVTVLSGPHVHKKSREQLAISKYSSLFVFSSTSVDDYKSFLLFKNQLNNLSNHSVNISFTYTTVENIVL